MIIIIVSAVNSSHVIYWLIRLFVIVKNILLILVAKNLFKNWIISDSLSINQPIPKCIWHSLKYDRQRLQLIIITDTKETKT